MHLLGELKKKNEITYNNHLFYVFLTLTQKREEFRIIFYSGVSKGSSRVFNFFNSRWKNRPKAGRKQSQSNVTVSVSLNCFCFRGADLER